MNILFTGGGSSGPVSPLLAIAKKISENHPKANYLFVGTSEGPEQRMVERVNIPFVSVSAGKLRRYMSVLNLLTPFQVFKGFFQALRIIGQFKPDCVVGAGGFVQVPVMWAAWVRRVPVLIHQQDVFPTLANKLCALIATNITVTFEQSLKDFPEHIGLMYTSSHHKVRVTGNPFREDIASYSKQEAMDKFNLHGELPVLYVVGGGTGAEGLNEIVRTGLPELTKVVQIIHSTGIGKLKHVSEPNYHAYEYIDEPGLAYAAADMVLCRAGLGTITELSNMAKIGIIIPMPNSHQEYNAELISKLEAAIVVNQDVLNPELLIKIIRKIVFSKDLQTFLTRNIKNVMPHNATATIADMVVRSAEHHG